MGCTLCPRMCGADRETSVGACGAGKDILIAKIMLHKFEEPCISLGAGSGAVFFSGCSLRCGYCQNYAVSRAEKGAVTTYGELKAAVEKLISDGAENLNFVTAAHYADVVQRLVRDIRPDIPVIYNSGGYERTETVDMISDCVDVFLPDMKYFSPEYAEKYSSARDYPEVAKRAISRMYALRPRVAIENGKLLKGTVIRHLVLPGNRKDSLNVIDWIADNCPNAYVSIMSQYTPEFNRTGFKELDRRVTTFEYESVVERAAARGLKGFMQSRDSAVSAYTPDF